VPDSNKIFNLEGFLLSKKMRWKRRIKKSPLKGYSKGSQTSEYKENKKNVFHMNLITFSLVYSWG